MSPERKTMPSPPMGTVTFLFTDIEGSTRLWEEYPNEMQLALARHDTLLQQSVDSNQGYVVKTTGDGIHAAFPTAMNAISASIAAQKAFLLELWPANVVIKVRMGMHTGNAEFRNGDYYGQVLNRTARLMSVGHGGQILISGVTQELCRDALPITVSLLALGEHRLKDLAAPESIYQVIHSSLPQTFSPLKSVNNLPTNLPQQVTSFIGREKETLDIKALLSRTRLLTLTGPGGCGKTRLSLQVAADVLEDYVDGVWFVELASLSDPGLLPQAIADALSLRETSGESITKTLLNTLKDRKTLLILDNCEHLLDASARLVDTLLRSCSKVKVLVSSREALGTAGENTYRVPSLSVPDMSHPNTPESLFLFESTRLFVARAVAVKSDFAVSRQNATALASVCCQLDGIPLAIELAAARVRAMPIDEINTRLDKRFQLLTGGNRTALRRQQTLRALIDWSYDLLTESEKCLFARLSVFAGGWTLEVAERVCSDSVVESWEVLDLLTSLVDKSLVMFEEKTSHARYRLLETMRQYAREKLQESGDIQTVCERHRNFFLQLAEAAEPKLKGAEQGEWLQRLEEEHENLRTGLDWSLLEPEPSKALRFCEALWRFWRTRGYHSEGLEWCVRALDKVSVEKQTIQVASVLSGAGALTYSARDYNTAKTYYAESLSLYRKFGDRDGTASSLRGLGIVAIAQGDYTAARAYLEESLILFRAVEDMVGMGSALNNLGMTALTQGDYVSARVYQQESLTVFQEIGDQFGTAYSLSSLGMVAYYEEDYSLARCYYGEALKLLRKIGDRSGIANSLLDLGSVACLQGDYESARAYLDESLRSQQELNDTMGIAYSLEAFANVAMKENSLKQAALLWGAAEALREEISLPLPPNERDQYDRVVREVRQGMGEEAFLTAWTQGRSLTREQAISCTQERQEPLNLP